MKKSILISSVIIMMVAIISSTQAVDVAGWEAFVIRNSNSGSNAPTIVDTAYGKEFQVHEAGQKAGWGTNAMNGQTVGDILSLSITRLNDPGYGPYINMWIKDTNGNYAVIANEPSNGEWVTGGIRNAWTGITWDTLKTKVAKIYETDGQPFIMPAGSAYTFEDFADYTIETPSTHWGATGAPDDINAATYTAYGFNWIFGDSQNNYTADYQVSNPSVVPEPATLSLIALGSIAAIRRRRHA